MRNGFDQLILSKCSSEGGKVLREFLLSRNLVAFDVEGASRQRYSMLRVERFEIRMFGGKTVPNSYQVQRAKIRSVECCEHAKWCHLEAA